MVTHKSPRKAQQQLERMDTKERKKGLKENCSFGIHGTIQVKSVSKVRRNCVGGTSRLKLHVYLGSLWMLTFKKMMSKEIV